ncbi:MAG: hypothetical protein LBC47_09980, partial [Tannerella sp.]|nr:hypothetical protein [Tannerella sp.]
YYRDLEQFTDKVTLTLLCNQTLDLIEYIRKCIESSYQKWDKKEIPFNLYLSSVDLPNDLMLTRQNDTKTVSFMLFFISSIHSANTALCKETETWLKDQMSKSLYMNGAPEKERIKFFSKLKEKVLRLYE